MPATQVSPALRRRISDDARQILRLALSNGDNEGAGDPFESGDTGVRRCTITHLSLTDRLQNFRANLRLELYMPGDTEGDSANSIDLRVTASRDSYVLRYPVSNLDAEVSVLNRAGVATSWITTADGHNVQLGSFLASNSDSYRRWGVTVEDIEACKPQLFALLDVLDSLDLLDVFRASLTAVEVPSSVHFRDEGVYQATSDKNAYVFTFDARSGCPLSITQAPMEPSARLTNPALQLIVDDYVRHDNSSIDVPVGIQSDVEILLDAAVASFCQWTLAGRQELEQVFSLLDRDDDGSVCGQDVVHHLREIGHSHERARAIAVEMTRLLCDSADPSEEVSFYRFAGFWIMMLADDRRVSDPDNERRVLPALQQLFLGVA